MQDVAQLPKLSGGLGEEVPRVPASPAQAAGMEPPGGDRRHGATSSPRAEQGKEASAPAGTKRTPGPSRRPMAQPPCCPWPSPARCGQPDQAKLESSAPRPPNEWAPQPLAELSCWRREQRSAPAASASSPRMLVLAPARCRVPPADTRPKGRGSSARPPAQQLRSKAQITPCFCQTLIFFPLLRQ